MITYANLISAYPDASRFPQAMAEQWIATANNALPDGRFKTDPDKGRLLFVMHNLTKPAIDVKAVATSPRTAAARTRAAKAKTDVNKKHVWGSTEHGRALIKATNY
jgi:phage terminase Nu1 subunit (DNA packaging protein)